MKTKSVKTAFILEIKALFSSMRTYLYIAAILLFSLIYTVYFGIYRGDPSLAHTLSYLSLPIILAAPLITAQSFAGERECDRMLISFGENSLSLLIGRLSAVLVLGISPLIPLLFVPIALSSLGSISYLSDYLGIFSLALFCLAYLSALVLISVCCASKKLCYVLSYAFAVLSYLIDIAVSLLPVNAFALTCAAVLINASFCAGLYRYTKSITVSATVFSALTVLLCAVSNFATSFAHRIIKAVLRFTAPCSALGDLLHGELFDLTAMLCLIIFTVFCVLTAFICLEKRRTE